MLSVPLFLIFATTNAYGQLGNGMVVQDNASHSHDMLLLFYAVTFIGFAGLLAYLKFLCDEKWRRRMREKLAKAAKSIRHKLERRI